MANFVASRCVLRALSARSVMIAVFFLHALGLPVAAYAADSVTDVRGRVVEINNAVNRIAIDDGRFLVALSLIHENPVAALAAWPHDINRLGTDTYEAFLARYPDIAQLPRIASSASAFSVESILAAAPDVLVVSAGAGPTEAQIAQLRSGGIPVVFIDFFTSPFDNLERSLQILAQLVGREESAQEFIDFRSSRMAVISGRLAQQAPAQKPTVFLEPHAGMNADCCNSPGRGNMGDYIDFVGGHNIGADVIAQAFGTLNLEYVIESDPDVYIATGGPHLERAGGLVLGYAYDEERARASLNKVSSRTGISFLSAVRSGNTHGFSHQLINSPVDIVAIEAFAKWIHPQLFADLDPAATLEELNTRFLQVPYQGTYWIDLHP